MSRKKKKAPASRVLRLVRAVLYFLGGAAAGTGLLLYGQVHIAEQMREQVDSTFFLWRGIGRATFFLQGTDVQLALALSNIDEAYLRHSLRVAWTLMALGAILILISPWLQRRKKRRTSR